MLGFKSVRQDNSLFCYPDPMCGRYEAGQKQKIAEAFHVSVMLDDIYFGAGLECVPALSSQSST
jgi:hypothetical protein